MIPTSNFTIESFSFLLCFIALAVIITWIAYLQKYFFLPYKDEVGAKVSPLNVAIVFGIVLFTYLIIGPFLVKWTFSLFTNVNFFFSLLQLVIFFSTLLFLFGYAFIQGKENVKRIWKDRAFKSSNSLFYDISMGLITFLIAMPIVITISQIAEMVRELFFGPSMPDQLAVQYLKNAIASPSTLIMALFSILIAAPFLEEYLFRGILLSAIRNKWGSYAGIFFSSLAFAFFHYSSLQESTNIPLIITLFTFALFLGFIYEKTRSLFSNIVLHVTFNSVSVIRIIFIEM